MTRFTFIDLKLREMRALPTIYVLSALFSRAVADAHRELHRTRPHVQSGPHHYDHTRTTVLRVCR